MNERSLESDNDIEPSTLCGRLADEECSDSDGDCKRVQQHKCPKCVKTFSTKSNLIRHVKAGACDRAKKANQSKK